MSQSFSSKQAGKFRLTRSLVVASAFSLFWLPLSTYADVTSKSVAGAITNIGSTSSQASVSNSNPHQLSKPYDSTFIPRNSSAIATVDNGLIHLELSAFAGAVDTRDTWGDLTADIDALGVWTDTLTINTLDASLLGKSGVLYGSLYRSGSDSLSTAEIASSAFADAQVSIVRSSVNAGNEHFAHGVITGFQGHSTINSAIPLTELIPISLGFQFGSSATLSYNLFGQAIAASHNNGWASTSADIWLSWAGISSVTDADGKSVSSYSVSSESGVDYQLSMAPVPLPATAWLFVSALLGIMGAQRRKISLRE